MKLGFVGTGAIASAMVSGLSWTGAEASSILVSPRNALVAADLAKRFVQVRVAASNQGVLDECDTVILAVRPQVAKSVLAELRFRPEHHVISVMSAFRLQELSDLVAPAGRVTRAVPLPSAAKRCSPTAIFPPDRSALALFCRLGNAFEVHTEEEFDALCASTATIASYFAFADSVASWLARRGIPDARARDYVAQILSGLNEAAAEAAARGFKALAADHATPGGTNELALAYLTGGRVFETVAEALDAVMLRITTAPR